jgi:hypothetical protein
MSKQIIIKTIGKEKRTIKKLFDEIIPYLKYFGFKRVDLLNLNEKCKKYYSSLFVYDSEKIFLEYLKKSNSEILKLNFYPLKVEIMYDVLCMRINQIANLQREQVFIKKIG